MKFEDISLTLLVREERFYVLLGLFGLVALGWVYLVFWEMPAMSGAGHEVLAPAYFFMMFAMWAVMMMAMMVPSAMPMILLYSHALRKACEDGSHLAPLSVFVSGYIFAWTGFSLMAASLHLTRFSISSCDGSRSFSVPNRSTQKEAIAEP